MRRHGLTILAAISLALLCVLLCGFFANVGIRIKRRTVNGSEVAQRHWGGGIGRGQCSLWTLNSNMELPGMPPPPQNFATHVGFQPSRPSLRESLWQFDARTQTFTAHLDARSRTPRGWQTFQIRFPIWCPALVCAIAPILWLRRRRKRDTRGFAVEAARAAT